MHVRLSLLLSLWKGALRKPWALRHVRLACHYLTHFSVFCFFVVCVCLYGLNWHDHSGRDGGVLGCHFILPVSANQARTSLFGIYHDITITTLHTQRYRVATAALGREIFLLWRFYRRLGSVYLFLLSLISFPLSLFISQWGNFKRDMNQPRKGYCEVNHHG